MRKIIVAIVAIAAAVILLAYTPVVADKGTVSGDTDYTKIDVCTPYTCVAEINSRVTYIYGRVLNVYDDLVVYCTRDGSCKLARPILIIPLTAPSDYEGVFWPPGAWTGCYVNPNARVQYGDWVTCYR